MAQSDSDATDGVQIEIPTYDLNHPKSYVGYAVAFKVGGGRDEADRLTKEYVVGGAGMARRGAENMGLIAHERDGRQHVYSLTERGEWLCSRAPECFEAADLEGVLETFDEMRGARERFVSRFPEFGEIAPDVLLGDPVITRFVDLLREIHRDRLETDYDYALTTPELFWDCFERDPVFAGQFFIRDHEGIREIVFGGSADPATWTDLETVDVSLEPIQYGRMEDGDPVYRTATTFQLANLMWHMGVTQSKGAQSKDLAQQGPEDTGPQDVEWALESELLDWQPGFTPGEGV